MPKIPKRQCPEREPLMAAFLAARDEFEDAAAWRRSRKGNLWRSWEDRTVTIFPRRNGRFVFSIADGDGASFSTGTFDTEEDAMSALAEALGVGE